MRWESLLGEHCLLRLSDEKRVFLPFPRSGAKGEADVTAVASHRLAIFPHRRGRMYLGCFRLAHASAAWISKTTGKNGEFLIGSLIPVLRPR